MAKYVRETKAGRSIAAWIVTNGRGELVANIQAHFSDSGGVTVNAWDMATDGVQIGRATGYGYDKLTAALAGMKIGGHTLSNHCEVQKKKPRGAPLFPRDYKTPRGYSLANFSLRVRDDSESPWRRLTMDEQRATRFMDWPPEKRAELSNEFGERENANKLAAMAARGDILTGYDSCFKRSGLDYLRARGLRVFQAI
jgi:hypothetical protein